MMRKPFRIAPCSLFGSFLWPPNVRRTPYEAYHDLLRRASLYPSTVRIRGELVTLKPYQVLCSMVRLAEDWGWHRSTVWDFLRALRANGLAVINTDHKVTILTLFPDGDASNEISDLLSSEDPLNFCPSGKGKSHSTDSPPAHSKSKESLLNSILDSKKEFLESSGRASGPFEGHEFTDFLRSRLTGPDRVRLTPDILPRLRAEYLDKLISEGRLNVAEKDRILLSSNGM